MSLIERHQPTNKTELINRLQKLSIKQMHIVDSFDLNYALARPSFVRHFPNKR